MRLDVVSLLVCVCFTGLTACSKKPESITPDRVMQNTNGVWMLDGKPWSGKHVNKFPNDKTEFEGEMVEGHPHGDWTWYFESGNKKSRLTYSLGLKDGNETHYYNNTSNTRASVKTWKRGAFVKSYQWQEDGTSNLPTQRPGTNGTARAVP